jgi:FlaA1/EpsC-like NDP-sugar epimerase
MEPEHLTSGGAVAVPFEEGAASADGSEVWLPRVLGPEGAAAHAVVVGTARSALGVLRQLRTLDDPPTLAGWIDAGDGTERAAGLHRLGSVDELASVCARAGTAMAIVCLPASEQGTIQRVRAELRRCGVVERFVPPLDEMLAHAPAPLSVGGGGVSAAIDPATLVGRVPRAIDMGLVEPMVRGKCVLVTGAGGSIGGQLARLAASLGPDRLVLVERSENALFEIDRQIAARSPGVKRVAALHDVVEEGPTNDLFAKWRPDVVFHAAAHKHVPLMEDHPAHAVVNNVFGTRSVAAAAIASGAERFVLISSDKAVHPTSVMGATKRIAEMVVAGLGGDGCATRMSMVRFGNVLGSASSVLPIWSAQLAEGGPLTVTDPRMTRYFMTIPEAACLVTQAAALAVPERSSLFVLDMGEPVRIIDLAVRYAEAHGLRAVVREGAGSADVSRGQAIDASRGEVDVVITGARPGEKLHEALAYEAEALGPTRCPGVLVLGDGAGEGVDTARMIGRLTAVRRDGDRAAVVEELGRWVPELAERTRSVSGAA